ncbi:Ig-like domain-containing protein [Streptomyces sp. NBC_01190]|uniref:Ig-like domain-containing protein n=1 Tax=Streptomyces sp. NBC_01190 TaxID=2903767 RepID=UPI003869F2A5|nr:Ig-like domain-containing protein [Streptomyces sp. NBC_01190]
MQPTPSSVVSIALFRRPRLRRALALWSALLAALAGVVLVDTGTAAGAGTAPTTAWRHGGFDLDPAGVVSRSDIVLGAPNVNPTASIPLGNGSLGVAAWAAGGFTAQLNRSDTMPDRKSPGQLTIPGLSVISHAADFSGHLDLTDGVLRESGGGMSLKAWVATGKDELIVDVAGADPGIAQSATISLWAPRRPAAAVSGTVGTLAETWVDGGPPIGSGQTFGSLAAITAGGRQVRTTVASPTQVKVGFTPRADGTFRVVVASPAWNGGAKAVKKGPAKTAAALIGDDATRRESALLSAQDRWWTRYWTDSGLIAMDSADGSAAYIENLRTLYLYEEAASMKKGIYPGSQAGEADMFAWDKDTQTWTPSAYWLWNLRTQISANMSSGNYALNTPIFDMYADDTAAIEAWTRLAMGGLPGSCVPETMRFNGNGLDIPTGNCSEASSPNWNALDISSGPEVALYMWEQYQATGDLTTLRKYFPFMKSTAEFQLAYQKVGPDGLLHANANAHETQWAVQDPTTDIAVDRTLFPIIRQAAKKLGTARTIDAALVQRVAKAETEIPPYPRTDQATRTQLLNPGYTEAETAAADATGTDMIAISYQPAAARQNGENIELEPLWPWNTVSDQDSGLFPLEQRGYAHRPNKGGNDWSMDAIDAARLENPAEVRADLVSITEGHQVYPNGFADLGNTVGYQPYIEQEAGVATAVDEALAQDYDGIIRFAPAWPGDWDGSGTVAVQGRSKVDVQVRGGALVTAAIEAGTTGTLRVKNPWAGARVEVVDGKNGHVVVPGTSADLLSVPVKAGSSYLVQQVAAPTTALPYAKVTGTAPTAARHLGGVQIGLDKTAQAGTATVGAVLGAANHAYGLTQVDDPAAPGATTTGSVVSGLTARTTGTGTGHDGSDMYFDLDNDTAATGAYTAKVTVSYLDAGTAPLTLRYDAGPRDRNHVAGTIARTGSGTWKAAELTLDSAYFGGLENAGTDLGLHSTAAFTVHSVGVSVTGPWVPDQRAFPPAPVVTTPRGGSTVKLGSSVAGTTIPDGAVTVHEGPAALCTATADDGGAWSCAPAAGLPRGRQTVTATVADPGGLGSDPSAAVSFDASDLPPGTAVVGAVVGAANHAYGMSEDETPSGGFDGPTTASVIDGLSARTSTQSNIYFDIDDTIAHAGFYTAAFTVSYFDQGAGSFAVHYDNGGSDPYKSTSSIQLTGTDTWKTATVTASDAYFGGQQHSGADFRLRNGGGQVTVHSVTVRISGDGVPDATDFAPPVTITSPATGAAVPATPTVAGRAEPDATVTVTADANAAGTGTGTGTTLCTATVSDDGTWSCDSAATLAAGSHTVTATATDPTGTPAPDSTVTVTVA